MQKTLIKSLLLIIAFTFALSANYIFAVWTGPTQVPPGGNTPTPIHVGTTPQAKDGALSLEALAVFGKGVFLGNVGIGVTNPQEMLDIEGGIKVGNTTNTNAGTIRWTGSDLEVYDGTQWKSLTASSVTTQAGLPFYSTNSTAESTTRKEQCQTAGGTVTDFQANSFCKFQASSCQSGWTRYQNLGSTANATCTGPSYKGPVSPEYGSEIDYQVSCPGSSCSTGNHNFGNIPTEICDYYGGNSAGYFGGCYTGGNGGICSASLIEVGCY